MMQGDTFTKVCKFCHRTFSTQRKTKVYCSEECRTKQEKQNYNRKLRGYRCMATVYRESYSHGGLHPFYALVRDDLKSLPALSRDDVDEESLTYQKVRDDGIYPGFAFAVENGDLERFMQVVAMREHVAGCRLRPMTGLPRNHCVKEAMTVQYLSRFLEIANSTVLEYVQHGAVVNGKRIKLKSRKVHGVIVVHEHDLKKWIMAIMAASHKGRRLSRTLQRIHQKVVQEGWT